MLGSLAINNGQNLQAMGLARLARAAEAADPNWVPGTKIKPWKSRLWSIGMGVFIGGSLINFSAFTFAPASVLVPLETVQYVNNIFFNKVVNKVAVQKRVYLGVALAIAGARRARSR